MSDAGSNADGTPEPERHAFYEDVLALVLGTLFVAVGTAIYGKAMLLTGGTVGLALLVQYLSGAGFWLVFSLVNLPFYALAVWQLGWPFALRTFIAVSLVALISALLPRWMSFSALDPVFATVIGGAMAGNGLLMLFRHRTGLGGLNILAIYLQDKHGLRAGWFQLAVDLALLVGAMVVLTPGNVVLSVLGAVIVNLILAINHKPGRYMGMS